MGRILFFFQIKNYQEHCNYCSWCIYCANQKIIRDYKGKERLWKTKWVGVPPHSIWMAFYRIKLECQLLGNCRGHKNSGTSFRTEIAQINHWYNQGKIYINSSWKHYLCPLFQLFNYYSDNWRLERYWKFESFSYIEPIKVWIPSYYNFSTRLIIRKVWAMVYPHYSIETKNI